MIHSKQKGQRYRRRQADDKDQHNEKEKAILRQGDNCDDQNGTCVVGPFNIRYFPGEKPTEPISEAAMKPFFQIITINITDC